MSIYLNIYFSVSRSDSVVNRVVSHCQEVIVLLIMLSFQSCLSCFQLQCELGNLFKSSPPLKSIALYQTTSPPPKIKAIYQITSPALKHITLYQSTSPVQKGIVLYQPTCPTLMTIPNQKSNTKTQSQTKINKSKKVKSAALYQTTRPPLQPYMKLQAKK